jgi:hypothetical protein
MSGRARLVAAVSAALLPALLVACGGTSSGSAKMTTPSVMEAGPDFGPGDGEPGDSGQLMDSQVPAEPEAYGPEAPEPEQPGAEPAPPPSPPPLTPAEIESIKALLVQASIDAYEGSCPCPYSEARDGSTCGGRSAYSRAGGEEPLCYPEDVSDEMVYVYWASRH